MRHSLARLLVLLLVPALLLAACGGGEVASENPPADGDVAATGDGDDGATDSAEAPAADLSGETLRVGAAALPAGDGNPYSGIGSPGIYTWAAIFDGLTLVDAEGEAQPALATSWESTSDTTWEFALREGVTFSNGEPFDAEAVVATVTYLREDEEGTASSVAADLGPIVSAQATDELTVEITTDGIDPILPSRVAGMFIVAPEHFAEVGASGFGLEPVGTGPYQVTSWTSLQEVQLEAFEDSWRAPQIGALTITQLDDPAARLEALLSGQVDIALQISPDQIERVEGAGLTVDATPAPQVMSLAFITTDTDSPLVEQEVRQALNYAVNKEAIVESLLAGRGAPAAQGATPTAFGYNDDVEPYPYDPEQAQELLAAAGYEDGFDLTAEVVVGSFPGDAQIYQAMQADLAAVGVNIDLQTLAFPEWLDKYLANEWAGEAFGLSWNTVPFGDASRPFTIFSCLRENGFYCDEEAVPLIEAAANDLDRDSRRETLHELQELTRENPPALFLVEQVDLHGLSAEVTGFRNENRFFNYHEIGLDRG